MFAGNTNRDSIVRNNLNPPIISRYIRFLPIAWHGHISMRVELYGCIGIVAKFAFFFMSLISLKLVAHKMRPSLFVCLFVFVFVFVSFF